MIYVIFTSNNDYLLSNQYIFNNNEGYYLYTGKRELQYCQGYDLNLLVDDRGYDIFSNIAEDVVALQTLNIMTRDMAVVYNGRYLYMCWVGVIYKVIMPRGKIERVMLKGGYLSVIMRYKSRDCNVAISERGGILFNYKFDYEQIGCYNYGEADITLAKLIL